MSLPTFSKTGVSTVVLSNGNVYPHVLPRILNRFVGVSDNNTIRVSTVGPPLQTIVLEFQQLTRDDKDALESFFEDSLVNFGSEVFTFTDTNGTEHTVQYLEPQLAFPEITDNNVAFEMVLTKVT